MSILQLEALISLLLPEHVMLTEIKVVCISNTGAMPCRPLRDLLGALLSVQPKQRPSAGAILRTPLLQRRIEQLLAEDGGTHVSSSPCMCMMTFYCDCKK